jgi:carbamate kinase
VKLVVALDGNALLRRGQKLNAENQMENICRAAAQLARVALVHEVVLPHGNGQQVGLQALQSAAYSAVETYPLDVLGAETEGMIGYLLEQELKNLLPDNRTVATLLTRVEVDCRDEAFAHPSKPIGPVYTKAAAERIVATKDWTIATDVEAACEFVLATGKRALSGSLEQIEAMLVGRAGTEVCRQIDGGANTL